MVEILTSNKSQLAEGPLYVIEENAVYWTDIDSGILHRYDLSSDESSVVHSGTKIGGFTVEADGSLLLFREAGAIHLFRDGEIEVIFEDLPGEQESRFNDVAADPQGRVFCGTMPTEDRKGRLYRLDPDGSIRIVLEEIGCSNGIGWTTDLNTMYYTDSSAGKIYAFDYDEESGEIGNQRDFFSPGEIGAPDGMTVDADDHVWVAVWGGGCLLKVDPEGSVVESHELPAKKITCPTFGGKDFDQLFVTAAGGHIEGDGDGAGELIRVKVAAKGKPEFRSKIKSQ